MRGLLAVLAIVLSIAVASAHKEVLHADSKTAVPNQYLVVFPTNSTTVLRDLHVAELVAKRFIKNDRLIAVFDIGTLIGYAAYLNPETVKQELLHPNVEYVEQDQIMTINEGFTVQDKPAAWGIDRVDQPALPLDNLYRYYTSSGTNVVAYVIDTGVLLTHTEFTGRATFGFSSITGETNTDLNGHGTHVAGTIAGITYGLAKKASIVAVKVLAGNGSGTTAGVVQGVDWVTKAHQTRGRDALSVANMSLGGSKSATLDTAVTNSIAAGINFAVAAGNNNGLNACNYSPAGVPTAITVGATTYTASTNTDSRSTFSNIGTCVSIFAPGQNILSSWIGSDTATNTISGTSMASPHVAGAVAVHLANVFADGQVTPDPPATIKDWLVKAGTPGRLSNAGTGSPNILLFSPYTIDQ